jgi:hypothetical protein
VKGIPTLVIANEEAVAPAWTSPLLILGICTIIEFERVVIVPSDLLEVYSSLYWLSDDIVGKLIQLEIIQLLQLLF